MPRTASFNLSNAQHRLLQAAAKAHPDPCTWNRAKYHRGLEVLRSLGLVVGALGGFRITKVGLLELGIVATARVTVPAALLEGVSAQQLERLVERGLPSAAALADAFTRQVLEGTGAGRPLGITAGAGPKDTGRLASSFTAQPRRQVEEVVGVACPVCCTTMLVTPEQAAHPILPCSTACEDRAAAVLEAEAEQRELHRGLEQDLGQDDGRGA